MNGEQDLDPIVGAWLRSQERVLPDRVRSSVLTAVLDIPQSGGRWGSRRRTPTSLRASIAGLGRRRSWFVLVAVALLVTLAAAAGVGQRPTTAPLFAPGSLAFTRDGRLFASDADGGHEVEIGGTDRDPGVLEFGFSPDGRHLAYARQADLNVVAADGDVEGTARDGAYLTFSWSPTSDELAIYANHSSELTVVALDGAARRSIPLPGPLWDVWLGGGQRDVGLAWSPDGAWIAGAAGYKSDTRYVLAASDGTGSDRCRRWSRAG